MLPPRQNPLPPQPPLAPGGILADKYRIERVIGRGGMGVVMLARHIVLGQSVAVKFLLPELAGRGDAVGRFLNEARAAAQLRSTHVAHVLDVGTAPSGMPYLVMEYLEGEDLGAVLSAQGSIGTTEAVDYVLQAIDAVAEAHALGIVHRDLKPANLFLSEQSAGAVVKVLDFGISKSVDPDASSRPDLTTTQVSVGSPMYMSPEQIRSSRTVDPRSDIWSLGVILYELLAGTPPFVGETVGELFALVLEAHYVPLRNFRADIPPALAQAVDQCLRRDRQDRFENVAGLAQALAPFASARFRSLAQRAVSLLQPPESLSVSAASRSRRSAGPTLRPSATTASTPTLIQRTSPAHWAKWAKTVLGGVVALTVVGVGWRWFALRPSGPTVTGIVSFPASGGDRGTNPSTATSAFPSAAVSVEPLESASSGSASLPLVPPKSKPRKPGSTGRAATSSSSASKMKPPSDETKRPTLLEERE